MYMQGKFPIISKKNLSKDIFDITVFCPEIAKEAQAGQFAQIAVEGFFLRRPISICDIDKENGIIRFVFQIRGKGTENLSMLNRGNLIDLIAPLGNGFKILEKEKKAVCIGGGIGTPPMVGVAKEYGKNATVISGFKDMAAVILQEDFKKYGSKTILCTDDGSAGIKGFVTDAFSSLLENDIFDIVYACGPSKMLENVTKICANNNLFCQVSLEQRMACGVGACLVCACRTVKNGKEFNSHVCKDGPVFDSKEVIF